jgi:hypothetical protein
VHKVVTSRDLLQRWLDWRRKTGPFVAEDTLDMARESLRTLHELVTPEKPLPDAYLALRGEPRA